MPLDGFTTRALLLSPASAQVKLAKRLVEQRADVHATAWRGAVRGKTPLQLLVARQQMRREWFLFFKGMAEKKPF